ncbi:MAG: alanine--tRNA ligase [Candidatus Nanoarchaeia archaeon]|nr:alanine--tRNA ligase [Candidatus Nanoarchaeia archaeon]
MDAEQLIQKYLEFFEKKGHKTLKSDSLIPENNASVLFTTAGMFPLTPYLMGNPHPMGKKLASVQKCIRTGDIEDVGDSTHLTFFEMLGNWSLGDYFKKESLTWSFEFLTKELGINPDKLSVTVFKGDENAPKDEESTNIWIKLGMPKERIYALPKKDNWWELETGPCGPDSEIFFDTGKKSCSKDCKPGCSCGKYVEIWNNVFMQYNKLREGVYKPLAKKNVDTGMGVERTTAILSGKKSVYETELFEPLMQEIKNDSKNYQEKSARIIADHIKSATMILGDERRVPPSKTDQGYILRRLVRRAIRHSRNLGLQYFTLEKIAKKTIDIYKKRHSSIEKSREFILNELKKEYEKFSKTLEKGLKAFEKISGNDVSGKDAFLLFQSYGFPIEITKELAAEKGLSVDEKSFNAEMKLHQELSKIGAEAKFKGGLSDNSEKTTKLHTATHLLAEALRRIVSKDIKQKGSNITPERLRFDFNFNRKLTDEELKKTEALVNEQISKSLPIIKKEMSFEEAKKSGAHAEFEGKYKEKVFVYSAGDFSKEVCGGPHISNTKELGRFKIVKEESIAAGIRRIKAILE